MKLDLQTRRTMLAAVIVAVILYGSLFPFQFRLHRFPGNPFSYLISTWNEPADWLDIIENVLIYIPVGFFLVLALAERRRRILLAAAMGAAMSICVELLQFFDRTREPSVSDVVM